MQSLGECVGDYFMKKLKIDFITFAMQSNTNQCIDWPFLLDKDGYGQMRHKGERGTHRICYFLSKGKIPDGFCVMHSCDNPSCINPKHLSSGTARDNHNDMYLKNRCAFQKGGVNFVDIRGEKHGLSKLDNDTVRKIRISREKGGFSSREIAKFLGVGRQTINDIVSRRTWTHID